MKSFFILFIIKVISGFKEEAGRIRGMNGWGKKEFWKWIKKI
jgi:hypothetical protein